MARKKKFFKGSDAWGRGSFEIPALTIAGSSDTGNWSDSPAPSNMVTKEINTLIKDLKKEGIPAKEVGATPSGNLFMAKRWVGVSETDYPSASQKVKAKLKSKKFKFLHDALS